MSKTRQKGTKFERAAADYLTMRLGDDVDRMPLHGAKDRGDLSGVKLRGMRCVVECKDQKSYKWWEYFDEMLAEKANDDAEIGVLLVHRPKMGNAKFGRNAVVMELDDLLALAVGGHSMLYGNPTATSLKRLRDRAMGSRHSAKEIAGRAHVSETTVWNLIGNAAISADSFDAIDAALRGWGE